MNPLLAFLDAVSYRNAVSILTPLWIYGFGALIGLAILGMLWGVLFLIAPAFAKRVPRTIVEGPLLPIVGMSAAMAILGLVGFLIIREPGKMMQSLERLGTVKPFEATYTIADLKKPDAPADGKPLTVDRILPVDILRSELQVLTLKSDGILTVSARPDPENPNVFKLQPGEEVAWVRNDQPALFFPDETITELYLQKVDVGATNLEIKVIRDVAYPQMIAVWYSAIAVVSVVVVYFLQMMAFPTLSAIALAAAKSEMNQTQFLLVWLGGWFILALFNFIPYNTFGEDIKMLIMTGLDAIKLVCIGLALWAAGSSMADEIEGKTALTLLSKPVRRFEFVLGKVLGIVWLAAAMFVLLGTFFLFVVSYKAVYDAYETSKQPPEWTVCFLQVANTIPGLVLAFFEVVIFASLGVALATRLPTVPNFVICFTVYVLGHLTPLIVQSSAGKIETVQFVARLTAVLLPMLDYFTQHAAIAAGRSVPYDVLLTCLLYCLLYSAMATLLSLVLFEDRDLS